MRIGYVLKRFPRLSETFILHEILELERQGVATEIFSLLNPVETLRHEDVARVRAPIHYLSEGPAAAVAVQAEARGISHLHAHFATAATTVAMMAGRMSGIPYSFTAHAKDIYHESVDAVVLKQKIDEARFVIAVSEYSRQHLTHGAGRDHPERIVRLYNGVDLEQFKPDRSIRREPKLIVGVGRLVEKKGFRGLVQACRFLEEQRSYRCVIIGDGPERLPLANQISALGLQDRVTLVGALPHEQVLPILQRATVLVLPCLISASGDRDALPTVLLEALATELPAISTTVGGIPEIIEHGRTGFLVPPGNPIRLADAIDVMLSRPALRERLARAGRTKAQETFDLRKNVGVLRNLFMTSTTGTLSPRKADCEDRVSVGG